MPVDPTMAVRGSEWAIGNVGGVSSPQGTDAAAGSSEGGFAKLLNGLQETQADASSAAQQLASGTATDQASVVMAVERARLAMQLASQIRTKAVEAFQDVLHTQI